MHADHCSRKLGWRSVSHSKGNVFVVLAGFAIGDGSVAGHRWGRLRLLAHVADCSALAVSVLDELLSALSQALLEVGFLAVAKLPIDLLEHSVVGNCRRVRCVRLDLTNGHVCSLAFHV